MGLLEAPVLRTHRVTEGRHWLTTLDISRHVIFSRTERPYLRTEMRMSTPPYKKLYTACRR